MKDKTSGKAGNGNAHSQVSPKLYDRLHQAFDELNKKFWDGKLPPVVLTFVRKPNSMGYFSPDAWQKAKGKATTHEIALNPDFLQSGGVKEALQTVAHEMVHLWQACHGKKNPKKSYHNGEFRDEMLRIGLTPSSTGLPGGKQTGAKMADFITEGGPFEKFVASLLKRGFTFDYVGVRHAKDEKETKSGKRVKYVCDAECGQACWGKGDLELDCAACSTTKKRVKMVREDGEIDEGDGE